MPVNAQIITGLNGMVLTKNIMRNVSINKKQEISEDKGRQVSKVK
jgi:hypothetical protein